MKYKTSLDRLKLPQRTGKTEVGEVIKGTTRNVIVVRSPDPKVFDEAIFIVREDYMRAGGVSRTQLLDDAKRAADGYVGTIRKTKRQILSMPTVIAVSAAGGTGLGMLLMLFLNFIC